ncbi:hypothetical protein [Capnocytophaga canis]|uniref:Lipoprotein n=1 Tax=Capnocytophaga canis TaxID=1848903 RepID=A0A0B7IW87_9FLAO|nr:hypothetical protein [Capnocytophaga canis]CEN54367.1 conserved hypothetical protein [Capnocytophaga canis]
MQYRKIIFYLFFCLLVSCDSDYSNYYREFEKIPNLDLNKVHTIYVIPNQGCGGCISEAEEFYTKENHKNVFFIFTQVSSEKYLRNKIKLSLDNSYVDTNNDFIKITAKEMKIYPYRIVLKNGKIESIEYSKDGNEIFN